MALVPKVDFKSVKSVLTSPEVIAVGSAAILAPLLQPFIEEQIRKLPFARDHITAAMIIISIVILLIVTKMKAGVLRGLAIGIAGANFFIGIVPFVQKQVAR